MIRMVEPNRRVEQLLRRGRQLRREENARYIVRMQVGGTTVTMPLSPVWVPCASTVELK